MPYYNYIDGMVSEVVLDWNFGGCMKMVSNLRNKNYAESYSLCSLHVILKRQFRYNLQCISDWKCDISEHICGPVCYVAGNGN